MRDDLGRLVWPPLGRPLDLLDNEANVAGANVDVAHVRWQGRLTRPFYVRMRKGAWIARVHRDGVVIDGKDADVGAEVVLDDGARIGVSDVGVEFRVDFVRAGPLERAVATPQALLFDHAGVPWPGRWWGLRKTDGGFEDVLVVAGVNGATTLWPRFRRGVALRELCARGGGVEPSLALTILRRLAARALDDRRSLGNVDEAFVTWDGELTYLPPLDGQPASPHGALVELFTNLLPETSPWWSDVGRASIAARDLWRRMVGPYLGGLGNRPREPDDIGTVDELDAACWDIIDVIRAPGEHELRDVARGLFPEEWQREQQLADELAVVDDRAYAALVDGAATLDDR